MGVALEAHKLRANTLRERVHDHVRIARLDHSIKQVFLLPGIVLGLNVTKTHFSLVVLEHVLLGFLSTTLIASSNYVLNELLDAPFDKAHPTKHTRPVPCGRINIVAAYAQWLLLMLAGLLVAGLLSKGFLLSAAGLWVMGCIYNIPPVRSKDIPYLDVLSESVNNPLRFCLGWYSVRADILPPLSMLLGYWMLGAYFMGLKRFSEYRQLRDSGLAHAYRKSMYYYREESLLNSVTFYAAAAMLFFGAFCVRYHVELILSFPFIAWLMAAYFSLSFRHESAVQNPEKLYREKRLMFPVILCTLLLLLLLNIELPSLFKLFPKSAF